MSNEQKKEVINNIIIELRNQAKLNNKNFDGGGTFLAFVLNQMKNLKKLQRCAELN